MKTVILFVSGILNTAEVWDEVRALLPDDALVRVAEVTQDNTLGEIAQRAWNSISDVSDGHQLVLCGFSFGGYVVQEMLASPQRRIDGLFLLGTSGRVESDQGLAAREKSIAFMLKSFDQAVEGIVQFATGPEFRADGERTDRFRQMMRSLGVEIAVRQNRAASGRADHRELLRTLKVPTSIVSGELDRVTPPEFSADLASIIPNAEVAILKGAGHVLPLERPVEVAFELRKLIQRVCARKKETV